MSDIASYRKRVDKLLHEWETVRSIIKREKETLATAEQTATEIKEAHTIACAIAEEVQRKAHDHIAGLVSRCLEAVFGEEAYSFRIIFEQKRNRTEARIVFEREGLEADPMTSAGGGVIDVAAFALRLAVLLTRHPPGRRILVLDEPFKFVSSNYRDRVRSMLEMLAEELDVQFLIVTHLEDLELGKVIRID